METWRVGRHYGLHLYRSVDGGDDEPVGTMLSPLLASRVVDAVNYSNSPAGHALRTLDTYQADALRTAGNSLHPLDELAILALGVAGEAGEVADYVKKVVGHGHPLDREKLTAELGDVLWYVAVMAANLGVPLSKLAQANVDKLKARYPNGFESKRSIERPRPEPTSIPPDGRPRSGNL